MKDQKRIHEGLINESLPNGRLQVRLDNEVKFEILFQEGFDTVLYMYSLEIESKLK
uniref:Translation initiation factor 1 n=1 Tax=Boswellia sacra TaxID=173701 RepID=A0A120I2B7_9ROSI|nr:translation initiation factor 1 [Boswellia sacra]AMB65118.1 translation initiation factor 1 [Boswellia sacra]ARJ62919.1 translation initiation factor 1 [Boswellia sacra]